MKLSHKINHGWVRPEPPMTDRYLAEIESAFHKAERAYNAAERRLAKACRADHKKPSPETRAEVMTVRQMVLTRLDELRGYEHLMRAAEPSGSNWSGKGSVRAVNKGRAL